MACLSAPLVDLDNPLYCPEISAHQYISSIRLFQSSVADDSRFPYFHRMCNASLDSSFDDSPQSLPLLLLRDKLVHGDQTSHNEVAAVKVEPDDESINLLHPAPPLAAKREFDDTSSDSFKELLRRPPKRIKRSSSHFDLSFVLSAKADRLRFSDKMAQTYSSGFVISQPRKYNPAAETFWPDSRGSPERRNNSNSSKIKNVEDHCQDVEPETPRSISALLEHLEKLVPGIRLRQQLGSCMVSHQDIVNLLGMKGHLNHQTIPLFRNTRIQSLRLAESMIDVDGLNLQRHDTLKALKDPGGFISLRSIVLSDVPLSDDDLTCLANLQRLESLFLDDTQIGDIAVMHLIALRQSLIHLELSWNDRISDDSIPTLCKFNKLAFLSLKGTVVTMKGLRKLACSAKEREKKLNIILPTECEDYICSQHGMYEVNLASPLIHDPDACHALSKSALVDNLATHASRNPEISVEGTKPELEKRLRKVLDRRKKDLVVQEFMLQGFM